MQGAATLTMTPTGDEGSFDTLPHNLREGDARFDLFYRALKSLVLVQLGFWSVGKQTKRKTQAQNRTHLSIGIRFAKPPTWWHGVRAERSPPV